MKPSLLSIVFIAACGSSPDATVRAPPTAMAAERAVEARCERVGQRWGGAHQWMIALTWAPGFCAANPGAARSDECAHPSEWSRANLGLHGLWPQWDSYCSRGPGAAEECRDWSSLPAPDLHDEAVRTRLATVMPGLGEHLDRHEWAKHGTCSGLSPDAYFALGEALDEQVNQLGIGKLLASRAQAKPPTLTAGELCAAVRARLGEPGAAALQIEASRRDQGPGDLVGLWFALADGPGPLAIDAAHLRVNPKRVCGVADGTSYIVPG